MATSRPRLVLKLVLPETCDSAKLDEELWAELQEAISSVYGQKPPRTSEVELYRSVQVLCSHGAAEKLFEDFKAECELHIKNRIEALKAAVVQHPPPADQSELPAFYCEQFLSDVHSLWTTHCASLRALQHVFLPFDRQYVRTTEVLGIRNLGNGLFRQHFRDTNVHELTEACILRSVHCHRMSQELPFLAIKSVLEMLIELRLYHLKIEGEMLSQSQEFFRNLGDECIGTMPIPEYNTMAEKRLSEERKRCNDLLHSSTEPKLMKIVRDELIGRHVASLIGAPASNGDASPSSPSEGRMQEKLESPAQVQFTTLVMEKRLEDLARFYSLFSEIDDLKALKSTFQRAVQTLGLRVVHETLGVTPSDCKAISAPKDRQKTLIPRLLELQCCLDSTLVNAFHGNSLFSAALKDAWEDFLNFSPVVANSSAQLLAKFCDDLLRTGGATHRQGHLRLVADEGIEEKLQKVVRLFRSIQAKDYFEAFYKKDLGKRLLTGRSVSEDIEKVIIQKLKEECGAAFTAKLESMFKELDVSKGIVNQFFDIPSNVQKVQDIGIDFDCAILASGIWPHSRAAGSVQFPEYISELQLIFSQFYSTLHKGRMISWAPELGNALVRATYHRSGRRHDLVVSQIQALCLLLFNSHETLAVADIQRATQIEQAELHRQLLALCVDPKKRILSKQCSMKGSRVSAPKPDDLYSVNLEFTSKMTRLLINQIQLKETQEEAAQTEERVEEDRAFHIDAAVVRVMKSRKSLPHNQLLSQVFELLRFNTTPQAVKARIETLISKDYLERSPDDSNTYTYLA
eukprot:Polyplicarium_translucidae@DN2031_c0_g1_i1.p1